MATTILTCWICSKAVPITECKFDEFGKPVHEECSVAQISLREAIPPQTTRQSRTSPTGE